MAALARLVSWHLPDTPPCPTARAVILENPGWEERSRILCKGVCRDQIKFWPVNVCSEIKRQGDDFLEKMVSELAPKDLVIEGT